MSRARVRIRQLAREGGLDPELALLELMEHGFSLTSEADYVPRSKLAQARRILALPRSPIAREPAPRMPGPSAVAEASADRPAAASVADRLTEKVRKPRKLKRRKDVFEWKTIGRPHWVIYPTVDVVEAIHWALVEDFRKSRDPIDPPGLRSDQLLASAVMRPDTSLGGTLKYPSLAMGAAALFHALVLDHPFHNGNKRTALVSLVVMLDINDHVLRADEDELYAYVLAVADHKVVPRTTGSDPLYTDREMLKIAQWIQGRTRRVERREFRLQFRQLRRILNAYGCDCAPIPGNRINIRRDDLHTQIFYGGEGREVEPNTIQKVRSDLHLDDEHGYDSTIFYNREERIPEFIRKYRRILERLARD